MIGEEGGLGGGRGGRPTGNIIRFDAAEDDEADYAHYTGTDQIMVSRGILFMLYEEVGGGVVG